jgi:hypothetical protein
MSSRTIVNNLLTINGSEGVLGTTDANAVGIDTNNAERLRVDASGNVGIEKMFER